MTGSGKTGLIYTKYICLYYDTYLLFCLCHPQSVNFIEFLMDFHVDFYIIIYDNILDMIQIANRWKVIIHFKQSKSGQILHVNKTCFPRPGHIWRVKKPLARLESKCCATFSCIPGMRYTWLMWPGGFLWFEMWKCNYIVYFLFSLLISISPW